MHFHHISYDDYTKARHIYIKGIKDLDKQLDKGIIIEDTKTNVDTLSNSLGFLRQYIINAQYLSKSLDELITPLSANYISSMQKLSATLAPFADEYARIQSNILAVTSPIGDTLLKSADLYKFLQENTSLQSTIDTINLLNKNLVTNPTDIKFEGDKKDGK